MGEGCIVKVFIRFPESWWGEDADVIGVAMDSNGTDDMGFTFNNSLYQTEMEKQWWRQLDGFNSVYGQNEILQGWFIGDAARFVETLPKEEIQSVLMQVMRQYLGKAYPNIPNPGNTIVTNWCSDPFTRGVYTGVTMNSRHSDIAALARPLPNQWNPKMFFAGEATHSSIWASVTGAWYSGVREARRIVHMFDYDDYE